MARAIRKQQRGGERTSCSFGGGVGTPCALFALFERGFVISSLLFDLSVIGGISGVMRCSKLYFWPGSELHVPYTCKNELQYVLSLSEIVDVSSGIYCGQYFQGR